MYILIQLDPKYYYLCIYKVVQSLNDQEKTKMEGVLNAFIFKLDRADTQFWNKITSAIILSRVWTP